MNVARTMRECVRLFIWMGDFARNTGPSFHALSRMRAPVPHERALWRVRPCAAGTGHAASSSEGWEFMAVALLSGDDDSRGSLRGRSQASEQAITLYAR